MDKLLRRTVRRKDYLFLVKLEIVEDVVEYLLRLVFVCEELHVVDKQYIHIVEFFQHVGQLVAFDRGNDFVDEFARRQIYDDLVGMLCDDVVPYRLHQMRFSESHASVKEERIVRLSWLSGHSFRSRESYIVRSSDNEGIKREFRIEEDAEKFG